MFQIAEVLKSGTVEELSKRMSMSELFEWQEYFKLQKERAEQAKNARG